jgi:hypothetical protein
LAMELNTTCCSVELNLHLQNKFHAVISFPFVMNLILGWEMQQPITLRLWGQPSSGAFSCRFVAVR